MQKLLEQIEKYTLLAVIFLFPVAAFSISPNPYVVSKLVILSFGIAIVILIRAVRVITSGKLDLSIGKFDLAVTIFAAAYLVSTIARTPNKMEAFLLPGTTTAVVVGALLYFLINQLDEKGKKLASLSLFASTALFSLISLLAFAKILDKIPQLPAYMKNVNFTPGGGYLPAVILILAVLPIGIGFIISEKNFTRRVLYGVAGAITVFALVVSIFKILPGKPLSPRFPDVTTSWAIAVDSMKVSPIFGVGPGNYLSAFNQFRPIAFNSSDLWAVKFTTGRNFFLTLMTEVGLLGTAGMTLLVLAVYRFIKKDFKERKLVGWGLITNLNALSLLIIFVTFMFFPATAMTIAVMFALLAFYTKTRKTSLNLTAEQKASGDSFSNVQTQRVASRFPALLITLPVIVGLGLFIFRASRIVSAEYTYKKSIDALAANDGIKTYDMMREAINRNPLVDRYHTSYAQVNLALANSIAQNVASPDVEVTDQDRTNIAQLVQQAIREGKTTVALNPLRAGNWEVLSGIYRAIIPLAQGADLFSAQTMSQAIALDPLNPNLRIALGGLYYAAGNFDTAIRVFELASQAKADLANTHFNLAFALRENGNIDRAIQEMTVVLSLVNRDSPDYEAARQALDDLQSKKAEAAAAAGTANLVPPQPQEEPLLEPPLDLPEESEPPEPPVSPTPQPDVEPAVGEEEEGPFELPSPTPTIIP